METAQDTIQQNEAKAETSKTLFKGTGSQVLLNGLIEEGVTTIFGYPGEQSCLFMMLFMIMPIN